MNIIPRVAQSPDTPVLILGETGSGKELIASAIHYRSPNFKGPFVTVNCAAIPEELIESELFGYEKCAFSGASSDGKKGLIESAAGGTLFLDEIGDLSKDAQAKLLRFLENGEFYKVGGTTPQNVQTRLVSATNCPLEDMLADGRFRRDLYFRIGVVNIRIPSLKERENDILPLAQYFLNQFNHKFGRQITGISSEAKKRMKNYEWPGNVRELRNWIEHAVLIGKGPLLELDNLPRNLELPVPSTPDLIHNYNEVDIPSQGMDINAMLDAIKKLYLEKALQLTAGNETRAARLVGLNQHTFRYNCKRLNIK